MTSRWGGGGVTSITLFVGQLHLIVSSKLDIDRNEISIYRCCLLFDLYQAFSPNNFTCIKICYGKQTVTCAIYLII